jgi:hypothetical protein
MPDQNLRPSRLPGFFEWARGFSADYTLVHSLRLKDVPSHAIISEVKEVYGKDVISLRAFRKWTAAFPGGGTDLVDLPGSGRLRDTAKFDPVRELIEGEGPPSQKKISQTLGIHHETGNRILRDDFNNGKRTSSGRPMRCTALRNIIQPKFTESDLISWETAQADVCRMCTLGMKHGHTWRTLGHPCGSVPMMRGYPNLTHSCVQATHILD